MPLSSLNKTLQKRLRRLETSGALATLVDCKRGIEKESLRITPHGALSQQRHPHALGAALTHAHITTDYAEALLEFITPAVSRTADALDFMHTIHAFVYRNIGDEQLWACSMPCLTEGDAHIAVAEYGTSNVAEMKRVYRIGLQHRYGGLMQTISGIHYNFSLPDSFWKICAEEGCALGDENDNDARIKTARADAIHRSSVAYMAAVRNVHRYCWLMLYLYGASPAVCACFLNGRAHDLQYYDDSTLFVKHATCLRMSDLGYHNNAQSAVNINCNDLAGYTDSLARATETLWPPYRNIGVKKNGAYRQLNANLLQIENEYYSVVRPKQVAGSGEKPSRALSARGVAYLEARFIDLNPFAAVGITLSDAYFLEAFLLFCILAPSAHTETNAHRVFAENRQRVIYHGRAPQLNLLCDGTERAFHGWAEELLDGITMTAAAMDEAHGGSDYATAVTMQRQRITDPQRCLSVQILEEMRDNKESFFAFAMRKSREHRTFFQSMPLADDAMQRFTSLARQSHQQQREMEKADTLSFDAYLQQYFSG